MLKKTFILFHLQFSNFLFSKYFKLQNDAKYGVVKINGFDENRMFLLSELFDKIKKANKRVAPANDLYLPDFITIDQLLQIINDIKIKF